MAPSFQNRSVSVSEIAQFSAQAEDWWDPKGPLRALHEWGPLRLSYVREQVETHLRRPLKGLSVLDVGCGGGLMAEALAKEGAAVVGLDASAPVLAVARAHAEKSKLSIDYRSGSAEALAKSGETFDVITALEIVEHVADLGAFMAALAQLLAPGGVLIVATVNRTRRSFLLAIVAAEYILGWVPAGTHDWDKFVRPSELVALWEKEGLRPVDCSGVVYQPLSRSFVRKEGRAAVNYFMTAVKKEPENLDS